MVKSQYFQNVNGDNLYPVTHFDSVKNSAGKSLTQVLDTMISSDLSVQHNQIYRGKDLTNIYSPVQIADMIEDGNFDDLYIGDYFDTSIYTEYGEVETTRIVLAGFDLYNINKHHAVCITKDCFKTAAGMNNNALAVTTVSNLMDLDMYSTTLVNYANGLNTPLQNRIIEYSDYYFNSASANTKIPTHWASRSTTVTLLSETDLYGQRFFGIGGYDSGAVTRIQLPLFRLNPRMIKSDKKYWLRDISVINSELTFVCVSNMQSFGSVASNDASTYIRAKFLLG